MHVLDEKLKFIYITPSSHIKLVFNLITFTTAEKQAVVGVAQQSEAPN